MRATRTTTLRPNTIARILGSRDSLRGPWRPIGRDPGTVRIVDEVEAHLVSRIVRLEERRDQAILAGDHARWDRLAVTIDQAVAALEAWRRAQEASS